MEIILKEDIIGLGYKNDIVNVKSGYGRNFLIPTGKAVIASASAKKVLAEDLKQKAHKLAVIKDEAQKKGAKKVGEGEATVHFHKDVEVKVPVIVVAENAPVEAAPVETEVVEVVEEPTAE